MKERISDPLAAALRRLRQVLAADFCNREAPWADSVHDALGQAAGAIQEEVRSAPQTLANVGEVNPDFRNAPSAQRHVEAMRAHLIELGEIVHKLRADIRQAYTLQPLDMIQERLRGQDILAAIEKIREADNKFLLETFNSNPGAGD